MNSLSELGCSSYLIRTCRRSGEVRVVVSSCCCVVVKVMMCVVVVVILCSEYEVTQCL